MIGFAKKMGMTRLFVNGKSTAVTALLVDQNVVVQIKTKDTDGYNAVQIGAFNKKNPTQARLGHIKKHTEMDRDFACLEEFRDVDLPEDKKVFDINDVALNDLLNITGTAMGKGFTGAVKRYGFAGQPASHGHDHVRAVGSIGARWPQRVSKGKRIWALTA
jgi:large subunit ribosomal protein L3